MDERIEYSFEADVTRLLSGINQGIKALDEFSEVVELASTDFDLSNKELDKLIASLNRMKSPFGAIRGAVQACACLLLGWGQEWQHRLALP